jgi:hypothetical protein
MIERQSQAGTLLGSLLSSYSRSRRLDDRIRRLCGQAVASTDPAELNLILQELTFALRAHTDRVRQLARMRPSPPERRQL